MRHMLAYTQGSKLRTVLYRRPFRELLDTQEILFKGRGHQMSQSPQFISFPRRQL